MKLKLITLSHVALVAFTLLLGSGAIANPQTPYAPKLDSVLDRFGELAMFNGIVLVDREGDVEYRRHVGKAQYELDVEFGKDSKFRIASMSKLFAEAVVASLVEKNQLELQQTIDQWLPDFPGADQIQIQHILEHRSGIPHTNLQEWGDGIEVFPNDEIVRRLSQLPLDFEPGQDQSYSNGGYAVLVKVLENFSGQAWPELLDREVLIPLELKNTGVVRDTRLVMQGMVTGYEPGGTMGTRRHSRPYAVEMRPGGGDMYSTAEDMRVFTSAIWRGSFAGEAGDQLFRSREGVRTFTGRSPGFYASALYDPSDDLLVVSLANNYSADFNWAESITAIAQGKEQFIQGVPELAAKPWNADRRFVGDWRYETQRFSQQLSIGENADGSLYVNDGATSTQTALLPLKDGAYLETLYFGICRWADADDERITCSRLYPEGFVADWIRR